MAATPEAKVKAKIHKQLKEANAYAVNYIGGQFANSGTPDILACVKGVFAGIEAKAGKNKPTALQISNLRKIREAGGMALVINETNLGYLEECLHDPRPERSNYCFFESPQSAND
jgi:hypothetical protein